MKQYILTSVLIFIYSIFAPACAEAYSDEMAQLAGIMNEQTAGKDGIKSVEYDGHNLILIIDNNYFPADTASMLESVTDNEALKPIVKEQLCHTLDQDTKMLFASLLSTYDSNLELRVQLSNGNSFSVVITPDDLSAN